ncbi:MAG TPA: Trm112 family protein [Gemmatimonadaceae bacterium]|nr:Trm112 family protein [Gemmatimonadaceae bacterium]
MLVDLLDRLRCPVLHDDSWLVATALVTRHRHIVEGSLGCPVCGAEYSIREGVVWFGGNELPPEDGPVDRTGPGEAMRLAALLALNERGVFLLGGAWGALAGELATLMPLQLLLVSPPAGAHGSVVRGTGDSMPFASGSLAGIAIDRASGPLAEAAARTLISRGRLLAPADTPIPAPIVLVARDTRHWVGECSASPVVSTLVNPRRAAPRNAHQ